MNERGPSNPSFADELNKITEPFRKRRHTRGSSCISFFGQIPENIPFTSELKDKSRYLSLNEILPKGYCKKALVEEYMPRILRGTDITVFDVRRFYRYEGQRRESTRYYVSVANKDDLSVQFSSMIKNEQIIQVVQSHRDRRRDKRSENIFVLNGEAEKLPRIRDLLNPVYFLNVRKLMPKGLNGRRLKDALGQILPSSEILVIGYKMQRVNRGKPYETCRYFVPWFQARAFTKRADEHKVLFENRKDLGCEPKQQTYHFKYKLSDFDEMVNKVRERFSSDEEPIFYRREKGLRELLGMSHQTLNKVLLIAKRDGVISLPGYAQRQSITGRPLVFYTREEIIAAILHIRDIRKEGGRMDPRVRNLIDNAKEKDESKMTIGEMAKKLEIPQLMLIGWIIDGKFDLGDPVLKESIRRVSDSNLGRNKRILLDVCVLENEDLARLADQYKRRYEDLDNLTISKYQNHRENYRNLGEVIFAAGLIVKNDNKFWIIEELAQCGVRVVLLKMLVSPLRRAQSVLLAADFEKAVEILKNSPQAASFRRSEIMKVIRGPELSCLPTTTELKNKNKYITVKSILDNLGIHFSGFTQLRIVTLFDENCPVSIIKYLAAHYLPKDQGELARRYIDERLKETVSQS